MPNLIFFPPALTEIYFNETFNETFLWSLYLDDFLIKKQVWKTNKTFVSAGNVWEHWSAADMCMLFCVFFVQRRFEHAVVQLLGGGLVIKDEVKLLVFVRTTHLIMWACEEI